MDVDTYLRQVKLENESIPDVVVAETKESDSDAANNDGSIPEDSKATKQFNRLINIDAEYQKLDSGFELNDDELKYFQSVKKHIHYLYGIQNIREVSSIWNYALDLAGESIPPSDKDAIWKNLLESPPAPIPDLCRGGVNYGCTEECLHAIADLICQFPGTEVPKDRSKWLFNILLILDELHAMSENVSYDLQRTRRALLRRCSIIESSDASEFAEELSHLRLLSTIISTHFKQR
ncbi:conserved hypothetical protein [Theileria orientalis strain Shintoku]|uniref:Uncharacterized protein n=1 Tax=Theileria orientalis strain Shintoku TaxID=869250 RepID=J4DP86_THEOR|nr:conserved hypothetical protein [Theileria orientalis strain Shintoku]BAM40274.1 conserved hypothetical protein [Theileria orientalis strain Shintoku]|eukprot:XP_009690575.1 conserved hypothetical protein [Theileria orientalis strain Shintoku]